MKENFHKILLNFYDFGHIIYIKKNHRGYSNETYKIETLKDNKKNHYILRYYKKGALEERIKFEMALMHELVQQGFDISPHVIPTKNHTAYAKLTEETGNLTEDRSDRQLPANLFGCLYRITGNQVYPDTQIIEALDASNTVSSNLVCNSKPGDRS